MQRTKKLVRSSKLSSLQAAASMKRLIMAKEMIKLKTELTSCFTISVALAGYNFSLVPQFLLLQQLQAGLPCKLGISLRSPKASYAPLKMEMLTVVIKRWPVTAMKQQLGSMIQLQKSTSTTGRRDSVLPAWKSGRQVCSVRASCWASPQRSSGYLCLRTSMVEKSISDSAW